MPEKTPWHTTCRGCGKENVQFAINTSNIVACCSDTCRKLVQADPAAHPIRTPVALTMDEYVKIAFQLPVLASTKPKPGPAKKPAAKPTYTRKPKKDILDFTCPTKFKRSYVTAALAWEFIREVHPGDDMIRPYTCPCGAIHIGHSAEKKTSR